jgi:recombination protein U
MRDFDKQDGIAFFLIYYTSRDVMYYMGIRELNVFWDRMENGGRKSFRFEELKPEHFMKGKPGQMVPYLDMVQLDLNERES